MGIVTKIRDTLSPPTPEQARERLAAAEQAVDAAELARGEDANAETRGAHAKAIEARDDARAAVIVADARERKAAAQREAETKARLAAARDEVAARITRRPEEIERLTARTCELVESLVEVHCSILELTTEHRADYSELSRLSRALGEAMPTAFALPDGLTVGMVRTIIRRAIRAKRLSANKAAGVGGGALPNRKDHGSELDVANGYLHAHELAEPLI